MTAIKSKIEARAFAVKAATKAPHIMGTNVDLEIAKSISDAIIGEAEIGETSDTSFKTRVDVRTFAVECLTGLSVAANISITQKSISEIEAFIVGKTELPEFVTA